MLSAWRSRQTYIQLHCPSMATNAPRFYWSEGFRRHFGHIVTFGYVRWAVINPNGVQNNRSASIQWNIQCIGVCMVKSGSCFPFPVHMLMLTREPLQNMFCRVFQEQLTIELRWTVIPKARDVFAAIGELFSFPCRNGDAKVDSWISFIYCHVVSGDCHVT